jgi:hypothetical protein
MINPYDSFEASIIAGTSMPYSLSQYIPIQTPTRIITNRVEPTQNIPGNIRTRNNLEKSIGNKINLIA